MEGERHEVFECVVQEIADSSARLYRSVVHDDPDFVHFFTAVTPLEEISRLRLGSRPARRHAEGGIDDLRAIPWVFSWTRSRIVLPAWLGLAPRWPARASATALELLSRLRRATWATATSSAGLAC